MGEILKAASVPVMALGFLPLWLFLKTLFGPQDIGQLIDFLYASALTLSFVYFGWQLRTQ